MKAILVIDMPDGENINEYYARNVLLVHKDDVVYPYYKTGLEYKNVSLRPMPEKMNPDEYCKKVDSLCDWYEQSSGLNICLDEILGETE